ncbi:MAG: glycosyltransferase family 39 protein [Patescibacteria group bacterium]|nr:glycosyltransferase family 39 protein [Patescibacteria group bacterium]
MTIQKLNKSIRFFVIKKGVYIIVGLFVLACLVGIFYNFSIRDAVGDETQFMAAALRMIANQDFRPDYATFLYYPIVVYVYIPFYILLLAFLWLSGLLSFPEIIELGRLDYAMLLPMARIISILFGVGSIILVYKISEKLFAKKVMALISAFLLASSLMFFQNAHFGKAWVPQIFFILLAFYYVVRFYYKARISWKDYVISALLIGLSFSIHGIGIFVGAAFLAAIYFKEKGKGIFDKFIKNRKFWFSCAIIFSFYFLILFLNPYAFNNNNQNLKAAYNSFLDRTESSMQTKTVYGYSCGYNYLERANFYNRSLFNYEPILLIIFIPSALLLIIKKRKRFFLIIATPLVYYLFITFLSVFWNRGCVPRYALPIIPFISIIAGYGMYAFYNSNIFSRKIRVFSVFLLLSAFLCMPFLWDKAIILPSTRLTAIKWIEDNIKENSKILSIDGYVPLTPNKEAVATVKEYNPSFVNQKYDYLINMNQSEYPSPSYYYTEARYYNNIPKDVRLKPDYLIIGWWTQKEKKNKFNNLQDLGLDNIRLLKSFPDDASLDSIQFDIVDSMMKPWIALRYTLNNGYTGPVVFLYKIVED